MAAQRGRNRKQRQAGAPISMRPMSTTTVRKNEAAHRYELMLGKALAGFAEYNVLANGILFSHTEVLPGHEGQGLSSVLIRAALDDVRALGTFAVPVCQVVAGFLRKHPEYQDLVRPEVRRGFRI
jgi:uncharacterized protein